MHILGLVGPIACGKGVVVDYLKNKFGYSSFSLSSILHDELKRQGIISFTRTTLQDMGDELRKKEGDGVLAKRAIEQLKAQSLKLKVESQKLKAQSSKLKAKSSQLLTTPYPLPPKLLIEGIRNRGEVEYLRTIPGFFLIAVDASPELRFQRVLKRGKPWDPKDWEEFLKVDARDRGDGGNGGSGQQVRQCMDLADVRIENEGDKSKVYEAVESLIANL